MKESMKNFILEYTKKGNTMLAVIFSIILVLLVCALAVVSVLNYNKSQVIDDQKITIEQKTDKIKTLFQNMEELQGYKIRVEDLEDDINRIDSTNMRVNVTRVECPLTDNEIKIFFKLIDKAFTEGGKRKDIEVLIQIQDKILEILESHRQVEEAKKSLNKIKANSKRKLVVSNKNKIGRVEK